MGQFDRQLSTRVERLRGHALYCVYLFYFLFCEKKGRTDGKSFWTFDIGVRSPAKTVMQLRKPGMSPNWQLEGPPNRFISVARSYFLAVE
jgi:hypothetical protein